MATSTHQSNRWHPEKIDVEQVKDLTNQVRFYLSRIEYGVGMRSYFLEDYYGEMFECIEEMYGVLDVGALAQDNRARYNKHKKKVREAHGSSS